MHTPPTADYTSLLETANLLGLPRAWLKAEAEADRIPHLRAGRRLLFDISAVRAELARRSAARAAATEGGQHVTH